MGTFHVTCVTQAPCPEESDRTHITAVGVSGPEGDRTLDVEVARLMLSSGDAITIGSPTDAGAEVRKGRCICGYKTIRTTGKVGAANDHLLLLPTCS